MEAAIGRRFFPARPHESERPPLSKRVASALEDTHKFIVSHPHPLIYDQITDLFHAPLPIAQLPQASPPEVKAIIHGAVSIIEFNDHHPVSRWRDPEHPYYDLLKTIASEISENGKPPSLQEASQATSFTIDELRHFGKLYSGVVEIKNEDVETISLSSDVMRVVPTNISKLPTAALAA